jgi:hypothetical protein
VEGPRSGWHFATFTQYLKPKRTSQRHSFSEANLNSVAKLIAKPGLFTCQSLMRLVIDEIVRAKCRYGYEAVCTIVR